MLVASKISGALAILLTCTVAVQAQSDGSGRVQNYFMMFFKNDDPLGQVLIILLMLLSVFSVAFIIRLFIVHRREVLLPQHLYDQVEQMIAQNRYREAIDTVGQNGSYMATLVSRAMNEASNGYDAMGRAIAEVSDVETSRMLRPLEYLNVIGNISPMMGLFGTVYGMIVAFQKLVDAAGRPEPQELAAGIGTALVTTFWGLIVAIPSLAGYALIRNKVNALTADGIVMAEQLIRSFKGRSQKGSTVGDRPTPGVRPSKPSPNGG